MKFIVYCDGSGTTDGPAGLGVVVLDDNGVCAEYALPLERATNQQAEILAAAYALKRLPVGSDVEVWSDSQYVVSGWNNWLPQWQANDWKKLTGGTPSNLGYWRRLSQMVERHHSVKFRWLRGHDGHEHNERADKLAGEARAMALGAVNGSDRVGALTGGG